MPTMKHTLSILLVWLLLSSTTSSASAHPDEKLVDVAGIDPTIVLDLRYATPTNFLNAVVYDSPRGLLRESVAQRLVRVQNALRPRGLSLKVWDAYRPASVQKKMWKILPDERYVASPVRGSKHSRGAAVDVTLVDRSGKELDMGTGFDDFSPRAFPNSPEVSSEARKHRRVLRNAMAREGFTQLSTEWWHFEAPDSSQYSLLDVPLSTR